MGKPLHLLIVEDSEDDTLLMLQKLRKGGYAPVYKRVETPQAMRSALDQRWDMVIADHFMPAFNAPDALNVLKESDPEVPFIIVSGNIEPDIAAAVLKAGARDYVKKDDMARLTSVVDRELSYAERHRSAITGGRPTLSNDPDSGCRLVADHMPDIAWICGEELSLSYINGAVNGVLGYTVKEALSHGLPAMLSKNSLIKLQETLKSIHGGNPRRIDLELLKRDGSLVYTETSLILIKDRQGSVEGMLGIMHDITDRKYAEAYQHDVEIGKLTQHFMGSLRQMAGGIAHEINNPLTVVNGFAQLLMQMDLKADLRRDIEVINEGARRISAVVNRMLQFARIDNTTHVPVNINSIMEVSLAYCLQELRADDISITIQLAPGLPRVLGDAARLQQIFIELISNARIEMAAAHGHGNLYLQTAVLGGKVNVTVKDDGPGIAAEKIDRIFEPFLSTRELPKGQGLGLSICHSIVTAHGGDIYAFNNPGNGATIIVNLPVDRSALLGSI